MEMQGRLNSAVSPKKKKVRAEKQNDNAVPPELTEPLGQPETPQHEERKARKAAQVKVREQDQSPTRLSYNPEATIGDTGKDAKIQANMSKNADLEARIAAMQA